MILPNFNFHEPSTLAEACDLLGELKAKGKVLAGGTDLIVNMKKKLVAPEHVVSIERIQELKGIDTSNGTIRIGACEKVSDLAESQQIKEALNSLAQGASCLGTPLIRNLATIAGNIVSARPAADLPPSLISFGAKVALQNKDGQRTVPMEEFFKGPGETVMDPDEILTAILIDRPAGPYGGGYIKLGVRQTLEISIVNVAAFIELDDSGKAITNARIVLGSVGPKPLRAPSAEDMLKGEKPAENLFDKAGQAAAGDSQPIDDFRASAEYRRDMVAVLTKRALKMALDKALEK